ncbi:MAG: aminotransferase class III-fold pyridoxal phosphate-dependent enzyme [Gemmatimonadota bacterium]
MADQLTESYIGSHPRSAALHAKARGLFAAQGATHFARVQTPFRPYISHASGSRKWDIDGNEYVDYVMGHGALVLGHSHPAVVAAVQEQAARGFHYGDSHPLEVEWAERIRALMPSAERIEFFASGQEANQMSLRIGRAFTGRKRLLKFKYNYHGWADELCAEGSAGALDDYVTVIPANDLVALEKELATRTYAVVLVEGGGGRVAGRIPTSVEFFQALPGIARTYGTVMVLDEVVTGFREAPGGWQSVVGITPDLTTIGKAASGGLPSGALVGRADLLSVLSPATPPNKLVVHGGTWNAVPLTCAAGIAACDLYVGGGPQRAAREMGNYLRHEANSMLRRSGVSARLYGRSVLHLYIGDLDREPADDTLPPTTEVTKLAAPQMIPIYKRLDLHLLQRGVASMRGEALVLSAAHTEADIDRTVLALEDAVRAMVEEGMIARVKEPVAG